MNILDREYTTSNGIRMVKCEPLNWRFEDNPNIFIIHVGSLDDMWQATYRESDQILSITSLHYSNDEVFKFKMGSLEDASQLVKKFAMGMGRWEDMKDTIFVTN